MKHKKKKRSVTLIEIMIVIMLIGLIGGALAFNMRGSVDKGKIFKSEQNAARVYDALMMASAMGDFKLDDCADMQKVKAALEKSVIIKDVDKVLVDGWGIALIIQKKNDDLEVYSAKVRSLQQSPPNVSAS
jgi:hypothetical protein